MEKEALKFIQEQINYRFRNKDLLDQAFTQKTFAKENGWASNQVLEFIGDEVLDFYVTKILINRYGFLKSSERNLTSQEFDEFLTEKNIDESDLTEIKKSLVDNKMLAHRIELMGHLEEFLYLGKGATKQKVKDEMKTKADLFEAILGAIAIDSNWNQESLYNSVCAMLNIDFYFNNGFIKDSDYVQLLQQWYQKEFKRTPEYYYKELPGGFLYEGRFNRFSVEMRLVGDNNTYRDFQGLGRTKSEARYECAKHAYLYLEREGFLASIEDDCPKEEDLTIDNSINALQELAQKEWISMPEYIIPDKEVYDEEGNSRWECTCIIESENIERVVHATNKKLAKKYAAYLCICDLMGYKDKYDGTISF